jgi:nuclear pore complex protein Nup160
MILYHMTDHVSGPNNALSQEDRETLASVLPDGEVYDSEFSFYLHAASLCKSVLAIHHEVLFCQLALSVRPEGIDTTTIWHSIISGNTDLGLYDDAYASLVATPYDQQYVVYYVVCIHRHSPWSWS